MAPQFPLVGGFGLGPGGGFGFLCVSYLMVIKTIYYGVCNLLYKLSLSVDGDKFGGKEPHEAPVLAVAERMRTEWEISFQHCG